MWSTELFRSYLYYNLRSETPTDVKIYSYSFVSESYGRCPLSELIKFSNLIKVTSLSKGDICPGQSFCSHSEKMKKLLSFINKKYWNYLSSLSG